MSPDLIIYPASTADITQIVNLVNSAYRGETAQKGWTHEAHLLDGIRTDAPSINELMHQPDTVILKCSDRTNSLAGCVYLQKKAGFLYLGMLTVSPEMQNKGIGKKLLQAAEQYARQHQCVSVVMTVISIRPELIAWYERNGYYTTGETEPFPDDPRFGTPKQPLEFVVMQKIL